MFGLTHAAAAGLNDDGLTVADEFEAIPYDLDGDERETLGMEEMGYEWDIKNRVTVRTGIANMPYVQLKHPDGSVVEIYLYGATVASWKLKNNSEVLYIRPDRQVSYEDPFSGGIPICFPQFGGGADSPGSLPRVPDMQQHGFARNCEWEVVATADDLGPSGTDVGVMMRLTDNEYTRSMWDFAFEARYEVMLMEKSLMCKLTIANPGDETFPFTCALRPYIGVQDASLPEVNVVGLEGVNYFDKAHTPGKVRARTLEKNELQFGEQTVDSVFVDTPRQVGLNVGTGASVVVTNMEGFTDHVVWNPGEAGIGFGLWRDFVCVESARVARPVKLPPQHSWEGVMRLEVWDEDALGMQTGEIYNPITADAPKQYDEEGMEYDDDEDL